MASYFPISLPLKAITCLLLLALAITHATAARFLDEETDDTPQTQLPASTLPAPVVGATTAGPAPTTAGQAATTAGPAATVGNGDLTFFLHDIIGGTNPSAIAVTGIVTNPAVNGAVPFAKPNGAVLSGNNGIPQNSNNNGIVNNNNVPFFTGLGGNINNNLRQSNNNNNNFIGGNNGFPVVNGAQLPPGQSLQKLMFGTLTVFDDELTHGHDLGSGLLGKAQGFYVASSEDGSSQTIAFTAMFESGGYVDSLTFFGVHGMASSESHLAIMGGTGKYLNAKGFALAKTINGIDQQNTDGVDTVLEFTVYLS